MKTKLAVLSLAVAGLCSVAQAVQVDTFDDLTTMGWHDQTGLMFLDNAVKQQGTGSMRIDFTQNSSWDDWVTSKDFWPPNQMDWSSFSTLSFWTKISDITGRERIDQITLWDVPGNATRSNVPQPATTDWTLVSIPLASFTPDSAAVDFSQIKAIQIKFTTWDTRAPNTASVWLDNMQVNPVPEPSSLALGAFGLVSLLAFRRKP